MLCVHCNKRNVFGDNVSCGTCRALVRHELHPAELIIPRGFFPDGHKFSSVLRLKKTRKPYVRDPLANKLAKQRYKCSEKGKLAALRYREKLRNDPVRLANYRERSRKYSLTYVRKKRIKKIEL